MMVHYIKVDLKMVKKCSIGTYIWSDGAKYYGEWNNNFIIYLTLIKNT